MRKIGWARLEPKVTTTQETFETRTLDSTKLLILDTETSGINPERDAVVCEVCLLEPSLDMRQGKVGRWFFELSDDEISRGSAKAFNINGYFERVEQEEQLPSWVSLKNRVRAAQDIARWTEDAILCGDNVQFDAGFLKHLYWNSMLDPNWNYHLLELGSMTIGYLGASAPLPWTAKDTADAIGVPFPSGYKRHTALGDCVWSMMRLRTILTYSEVVTYRPLTLVT